ncbi:uncharacterized protein F4822DRAFT_333634 [Hypoxylon trugodes]|uniref:uncharacterized protein n=1 Tax=Hypoxylon trugodes TaxID=326681 RepID=UPI00219F97EE|nr:uncharacterized protein F4822DRAFT_333634 [Hypoxylon trugodes]KAI1387072.1 hypothetical protein F4822DRAFT_333634 [Hypoxylon trugodes]
MLAKQQYSAILYAALFGSLVQAAQFPTCITSCIRQSGCSPTDTDCMCEKSSDKFLSDAVICMNQWCPADTKFSDLVGPIQSNCDIPQSAIDAAQAKAGFDTGSTPSSTSKPSATGDSKGGASVSIIMSVGEPAKIDPTGASTSAPAPTPTGNASKGSSGTTVLGDSTAVVTQTPTASGSLLVAASTFSSATGSPSSTAGFGDSSSDSTTQNSSDGSPAGGSTAEGAGATSQASMLAAVLAVAAAMAFGW